MTNLNIKNLFKQALIIFVMVFATPVSANIGKIVYGYGNNHAFDSDGNRRELRKGSEIREGDTLVTGRGRIHVRLNDGGFISVYPNSKYKIDEFKFSGKSVNDTDGNDSVKRSGAVKKAEESKDDRGFFSLLKGAARQVTGLLGRTYNKNFKFKTAVATIGIRGTGFFARLCQADCFDADGNPMQDGMYIKNNTGVITMTNNAGDVALAQGQSAFAASREDSPQQTAQPPVAYNTVTPDIELYDFDEKVVDSGTAGEIIIDPVIDPTVNPPSVIIKNMEYTTLTSNNKSISEPLYGLDTADINSSVQQNGDEIKHFETEVFVAGAGLVPVVFDQASGVLAESGKDATLGVLWNRWSGGYTHTQLGNTVVSLDNNIHMIGSSALTQNLPAAGVLNYSGTAGTSPTFSGSGTTGNLVGTQTVAATINFETAEVTALDITATFSDAVITAQLFNTSGNTFISSSGNFYDMSGSCTDVGAGGCGANGLSLTGTASLSIVGTNAEGIYGIYNLTSGTGENAVSGSYFATENLGL